MKTRYPKKYVLARCIVSYLDFQDYPYTDHISKTKTFDKPYSTLADLIKKVEGKDLSKLVLIKTPDDNYCGEESYSYNLYEFREETEEEYESRLKKIQEWEDKIKSNELIEFERLKKKLGK